MYQASNPPTAIMAYRRPEDIGGDGNCRRAGAARGRAALEAVIYASPVHNDAGGRVFRVTVRGRFRDLSEEARRYLVGAQAEHDILKSAYSSEGTFTYDSKIDFFNLRCETRPDGLNPDESAAAHGLREAETFLRTMRLGYRDLKVDVVDMSAIWADVDLRRRG